MQRLDVDVGWGGYVVGRLVAVELSEKIRFGM